MLQSIQQVSEKCWELSVTLSIDILVYEMYIIA